MRSLKLRVKARSVRITNLILLLTYYDATGSRVAKIRVHSRNLGKPNRLLRRFQCNPTILI